MRSFPKTWETGTIIVRNLISLQWLNIVSESKRYACETSKNVLNAATQHGEPCGTQSNFGTEAWILG